MLKQRQDVFYSSVEFDTALLVFRGALGRTQLARVLIALQLALVYIRVLIK